MLKSFTPKERNWMLYDVGNSAFILLVTTILPIYFKSLTEGSGVTGTEYFAYWGMAMTASTLITAVSGPLLGRLADGPVGRRKSFLSSVVLAVFASLLFPFFKSWQSFLIAFVVAKVGYNISLIFYDAMLVDTTDHKRADRVSATGFALGYIGSCIPFVISLAMIMLLPKVGVSMTFIMTAVFILNGAWWFIFTLPLLRSYEQTHRGEERIDFKGIKKTLIHIYKDKALFFFLVSFFFYIDGVYTIINMATAYGESLGLKSEGLLLALLVTQIVAFPASLVFAKLSGRMASQKLIAISIAAYTAIALFAVQLDNLAEFWILAIAVGLFQGGIQSISRSHFMRLIPAEQSGEYFGIYDIFGKGASVIGTFLVSSLTHTLGSQSKAILALVVLFILGGIFFKKSLVYMNKN